MLVAMMERPILCRLLVATLLVVFAGPAAGQSTCDAGKLKCVRNKLSCLIKVHEKSQKKGLPPDAAKLQKCMDKFDGGTVPEGGCFARLEAKQDGSKPATECSATGDVATVEADVDAYITALLALLNLTVPSTIPSTTTSATTSSTTSTTLPLPPCDGCDPCNEVCTDCAVLDAKGAACGWFDEPAFKTCVETLLGFDVPGGTACSALTSCVQICQADPGGLVCFACSACRPPLPDSCF